MMDDGYLSWFDHHLDQNMANSAVLKILCVYILIIKDSNKFKKLMYI